MKARFIFLLSYFLFWLLFFQSARLVFFLYHWTKTSAVPFAEIVSSFWYGMRMDVSMISYLFIPVCLFVVFSYWIHFFRTRLPYAIYSFLIAAILLLIVVADLEVYGAWGFRIDNTPLRYLASPKEAWASVSHLPVFLIVAGYLVITVLFCLLLNRFLKKFLPLPAPARFRIIHTLATAGILPLLVIPIRGGFQLSPMNQSAVFFSKHHFANVGAINAAWNFMHGVMSSAEAGNNYQLMPAGEVKKIVDSLYTGSQQAPAFLNTHRPNIIYIIWESFTAKAVDHVVNGQPIVPGFNELRKEGLYFSNLFASGDRTDKGLAAILSSYPALNKSSIIRTPGKLRALPSITGLFKTAGYQSSFYYGGETEFANIKSYLYQNGFDNITDKNAFSKKDQNSKWGAHDGVVGSKIIADMKNIRSPFFLTWLTLTSHEPYEVPDGHELIQGDDPTSRFLNSIRYTDKEVFDFIRFCKSQPWWKETIVVIVGDHGHLLPQTSKRSDDFRIPMLLLGGALISKGEVRGITAQTDLSATLAMGMQLGSVFPFGKNLFDSTKQWAFFTFNDGFGLVNENGLLLYDNAGQSVIEGAGPQQTALEKAGRAIQQNLHADFGKR